MIIRRDHSPNFIVQIEKKPFYNSSVGHVPANVLKRRLKDSEYACVVIRRRDGKVLNVFWDRGEGISAIRSQFNAHLRNDLGRTQKQIDSQQWDDGPLSKRNRRFPKLS